MNMWIFLGIPALSFATLVISGHGISLFPMLLWLVYVVWHS